MTGEARWLGRSERWLRLTLRLYPVDFRDELGESVVEAYRDRCRAAYRRGGAAALAGVWLTALADAVRNGPAERLRPAASWRRSGNWGRDAELALRRLVRAPVFAATMVGTLAVGLGAFAVVYTVVHKVLLAPLPYERAEDLYFVWRDYSWFELDRGWLGGTDVAELRRAAGAVVAEPQRAGGAAGPIEAAVGLLGGTRTLSGRGDAEPIEIPIMMTSPELFDVLGVRPALGRGFAPDEAGPGRPPVLVLTHGLWTRLGADPSIIGADLSLNGQPFTVIGVLPRGFHFVRHASLGRPQPADAYITLDHDLAETNPGAGSYAGLIRARPGMPPDVVASAVATVGAAVDERDFQGRGLRLYPVGLKEDLVGPVRPALVVLGLAGLFLLLVLLVNLATLLLSRAAQREQEFAVSRALGANGLALVRATLLEGGLLGLAGGAAGALAAVWGTSALVTLAPLDLPRRETIAVDWGVAAVVIGTGLLLGVLAAAAPAAWAARTRLTSLLRNAAVRGGGGQGRMRRGMVVVQVALSLVLLSAGALVVRSLERLLSAEPGFEAAGVLTARVPVPTQRYPDAAAAVALHERIERELAAIPGVAAVGAATALPLTASASQTTAVFPGAPGNSGDRDHDAPLVDHISVRPGYFDALGMRVLAGRAFEPEPPPGVRQAMIDPQLAERFFPGADPIGTTLSLGGDTLTVIGVVAHARMYDLHRHGREQVYMRASDRGSLSLSFVVRSARPPSRLVSELRAAIRRADPQLAITDVRTMDDVVRESLREQRLNATLIGGFALGALLLAAMGLFGVVSGSVTRRRHELAVRLALGADHRRLLRLVLREGALLILLGILFAAPGIYLAGRVLRGVVVGISPFDPPTLAAVAAGLGLVAMAACYLPARRVLGIEPGKSLRQE